MQVITLKGHSMKTGGNLQLFTKFIHGAFTTQTTMGSET